MRIKQYLIFAIGLVALVAISCNKQNATTEQNCEKPQMYETSELAQLMRDMYADNEKIKEKLLKGEWPDSLPDYFSKLHTAKATDPSDINETYKGLGNSYLQRFEELKSAPDSLKIESYNSLINGCVSCHQVYCNGPLPKIKKLLITQ